MVVQSSPRDHEVQAPSRCARVDECRRPSFEHETQRRLAMPMRRCDVAGDHHLQPANETRDFRLPAQSGIFQDQHPRSASLAVISLPVRSCSPDRVELPE